MSSTTLSLSSSYPENICPCRGHFLPTRQATQNRDFLRNRFLLEIASTKEIQGVWLCWTIPRNGKANTNFLLFGLIFWFQLTWSPKLTSLFCMYESFIQTEDDQWFLARESEESKGFLAKSLTRIFEQLFCPPPNLFRRSLNRIEKYEIKAWWVMICVLISISISRSPPKTEQLNLRLCKVVWWIHICFREIYFLQVLILKNAIFTSGTRLKKEQSTQPPALSSS